MDPRDATHLKIRLQCRAAACKIDLYCNLICPLINHVIQVVVMVVVGVVVVVVVVVVGVRTNNQRQKKPSKTVKFTPKQMPPIASFIATKLRCSTSYCPRSSCSNKFE